MKKEYPFNQITCAPQNQTANAEPIQPINSDMPNTRESSKLGSDYDGQLALQMPKSLHHKLSQMAKDEGVLLEQFIVYILTETTIKKHS